MNEVLGSGETIGTMGGPIDRVTVALRFVGDDLDPSEVSKILGCAPTLARRKGDVVQGKHSSHIQRTGVWSFDGTAEPSLPLELQVMQLLDRVCADQAAWRILTARFEADVFCGLFLEHSNREFSISSTLSRRLAELGLEISFDIYGPE